LIAVAEKVTQKKVNTKYGDRRSGDPDKLVGDSAKIRTELGWDPQYANLEEILETAWHWHQRLVDEK
ncbi:MAG TPA: UDP-glucose 4-epimerase GalE, partial [Gammaproteobacteria bacterium]|nr:UDP-glucose 4-epimerase GalE [Gammaproteobacteria bacterium]